MISDKKLVPAVGQRYRDGDWVVEVLELDGDAVRFRILAAPPRHRRATVGHVRSAPLDGRKRVAFFPRYQLEISGPDQQDSADSHRASS